MSSQSRVWFVTGASVGLGLELVHAVLARGDRIIATMRDPSKMKDAFPDSDNLRILKLDVTAGIEVIRQVADKAIAFWGRVDVLVNNAGYAEVGVLEEVGSQGLRKQYDTNVFGNLDVTIAFLPYMRERKAGIIVQLGSRIVWTPELPGISLYASSKAAVHTFSETLAQEVAPFNIKVLIFEPGGFRSRGTMEGGVDTSNPIPDYDETRKGMLETRKRAAEMFRGDPRKLMKFLVDVIRSEGKAEGKPLPKYLVCGPGANEGVLGKCEIMKNAVDEWRWVTKELMLDNP